MISFVGVFTGVSSSLGAEQRFGTHVLLGTGVDVDDDHLHVLDNRGLTTEA